MPKQVDPAVSKYMSDLAKKRKNPYYHFKDKDKAKEAGERGKETQKRNREKAGGQDSPEV